MNTKFIVINSMFTLISLFFLSGCQNSCYPIILDKEGLNELMEALRLEGDLQAFFDEKDCNLSELAVNQIVLKDGKGLELISEPEVISGIYSPSLDCANDFNIIVNYGNKAKKAVGNSVVFVYQDKDIYSKQLEHISSLDDMTLGTMFFFEDKKTYLQQRTNLKFRSLITYDINNVVMYRSKDVKTQFECFQISDIDSKKVAYMIVVRTYPT